MSIEVKSLSFSYGEEDVFSDISLSVQQGQVLCLLGPNGTGKSTLIKVLAGVLKPKSGRVLIDDRDIRELSRKSFAKRVAYIPQSSTPIFPFLVRDLVVMGRTPYKGFFSSPNSSDYVFVRHALHELGIEHLEYKSCTNLSGGERQLVLFAGALVQEPQILILDEPTSHLDFGNQMKLLGIIKQLSKTGISVIMATHAPEQAFLTGDLVAIMKDGNIFAFGRPSDVITESIISSTFDVSVKILETGNRTNPKACVPVFDEEMDS